jgi:hypothetical protein
MTTLAIEYFVNSGLRTRLGRVYDTDTESYTPLGPYGTNSISSQKGCCAVSRSGDYIAIAGAATVADNPEVRVVRVSDGVTVHQFNTPAGWVGALAFNADDTFLFILQRNGKLYRMNLASGVAEVVAGTLTNVIGLAVSQFTTGPNVLALYSVDASILLDADSFEDLGLVSEERFAFSDTINALSPGGKYLCVLPAPDLDPVVYVYSLFEKNLAADLSLIASNVRDAAFTQNDRYLLIAAGSTGLVVVDTATWETETIVAPGVIVSSVCMSPDFTKAYVWTGTGGSQALGVVDMSTWGISYPDWAGSPGSTAVVSMLRAPAGVHPRLSPEAQPFWAALTNTYESVV